ncbi:Hypothetical predicted protein [Mytilus galloprovincialis]|uniref:Uncharacterized protein n=1 Tax=Mytilus galloprovincialis TaxID=29158 RepID=A0A8B6D906_MYTGA|nr:Hypothetical predicted protein [Mytilus galloprovincialis]
MTNKLKREHEKKLSTNAKKNPKAIWKYIKSKSKTRSGIGELLTDQNDETSRKTDDDKEKAEILATFFNSVFTKEPEGEVHTLPIKNTKNKMLQMNINKEEIAKILKGLKVEKSPGPDRIHPRILKELAESISTPLCIIFNQSIRNSTVPSRWKEAQISAIFKKGKKCIAGNYRPVSLTSVVCKVMEKLRVNKDKEYKQRSGVCWDGAIFKLLEPDNQRLQSDVQTIKDVLLREIDQTEIEIGEIKKKFKTVEAACESLQLQNDYKELEFQGMTSKFKNADATCKKLQLQNGELIRKLQRASNGNGMELYVTYKYSLKGQGVIMGLNWPHFLLKF